MKKSVFSTLSFELQNNVVGSTCKWTVGGELVMRAETDIGSELSLSWRDSPSDSAVTLKGSVPCQQHSNPSCGLLFWKSGSLHFMLICPLCRLSGGELFDRLVAEDYDLKESDCITYMRQICQGVQHIHGNNIIHLDLKVCPLSDSPSFFVFSSACSHSFGSVFVKWTCTNPHPDKKKIK